MLLGLTGNSGSWKTATARHFADRHGFARLHAGEPVKSAVRKGFGLDKTQTAGDAKDDKTSLLGGVTPRRLMEAWGTALHDAAPSATAEIMRRRVQKLLDKGRSVVVDGVRSPIEAAAIKDMGGHLVRTDNGNGPDPRKPLDRRASAIKVDYTIDTSGDKAARKAAADRMLADLRACEM